MAGYVVQFLRLVGEHPYLIDRCPELAQYVAMAQYGRMSEGMAKSMLFQLEEAIDLSTDYPCFLHRAPREDQLLANGKPEIEFLTLQEGEGELRCGIRLADRPRHMLVAGSTGSGKTTALRNVITRVHEMNSREGDERQKTSVLVLQIKPTDFTDLGRLLGPAWLIFSVHAGMKLGLNGPDVVPPELWTQMIATWFSVRAGLINARVALAGIIRWLLPILNPEGTAPLRWPSWENILEALRKMPKNVFGAKSVYMQSLETMLYDVVQSTGGLLQSWRGLDLETQVVAQGKNAVLDLSNIYPPWIRLYIVDYLVSQLLIGRMYARHRADTTEVLLVIDEADALVSRQAAASFQGELSPVDTVLKMGRAFGIASCIGLTAMGSASRQILSNVQYHLCMNMSDEESVQEARRTLMLPRGAELQFPALQPGEAIFREAQGAWPHPMLVKVDYVPPSQ